MQAEGADGNTQAENRNKPELSVTGTSENDHSDEEERRPPLPPRPSLLKIPDRPSTPTNRPSLLQAKATTALSSIDIQTVSFPDGSRGTFSTPASRSVSESTIGPSTGSNTPSRKVSRAGSDFEDSASLMSYAPTLRANGDLASLLDEGLNAQSPAWRLLNAQAETVTQFENIEFQDNSLSSFEHEFDEIDAVDTKLGNEGQSLSTYCEFLPDPFW